MGEKNEWVNGTEMAAASEEFDAETVLNSPALLVDRAARLMTGEAEPAKNLLRRLQENGWQDYLVGILLTLASLTDWEAWRALTDVGSALSPLG